MMLILKQLFGSNKVTRPIPASIGFYCFKNLPSQPEGIHGIEFVPFKFLPGPDFITYEKPE